MFGWIPIIGPIIDGIVNMFNKVQDKQIVKYTVDGKVDVAAMESSAAIIAATKDDIGVRLARDLIMFPVGIWTAFVSWDNLVVYVKPEWFWKVSAYPPSLEYLPYAVLSFLFGATAMQIWKR